MSSTYRRNSFVALLLFAFGCGIATSEPSSPTDDAPRAEDGVPTAGRVASFANTLSPDDAEAIRAYIVNRANEDAKALAAAAPAAPN